ncbi:MAG: cell division protein FtsZ [Gammaproteobacteria bacterium RIFCSPLOWO2_02_FULL_42_9]|nr:MAG: cell division protein FtsZ [Gammaproteobacteria bacterium RIFCSPLOWO2_02_FULL_42_9]
MAQIKPDMETFAKIKVVGVGGGGGNIISRMIESKIQGVEFIAINADSQDLHHCLSPQKLLIGKNLTKGLGAGMNPDVGRQAAEENRDEIHEVLKGADLVFITYGLGGGVGTGAGSIVAEAARDVGALTVGVVTKPFSFEGSNRMRLALEGLNRLQDKVDTLITIPNDKLLQTIDRNTSLTDAFKVVDDVLRQAVQGISDIIVTPGLVNVDFADLRAVMTGAGSALMGIGKASGDDRAVVAAKMAINSPLLEVSIDGAKGVIFNVAGGDDLTMIEINEAAKVITDSIDSNAKVIFGAVTDKQLKKGEIKITVIAAGFGDQAPRKDNQERRERSEVKTEPIAQCQEAPSHSKKQPDFASQVSQIENSDEEWDIPAFIRKKMK